MIRVLTEIEAQGKVEYSLIIALISVASLATLFLLRDGLTDLYIIILENIRLVFGA